MIIVFTIWIACKIIQGLDRHFPFLPWMLFVTWGSHHIRDAERRGLWFPPFGSSSRIPYFLYLSVEFTLPMAVKYLVGLVGANARTEEVLRDVENV